MATKDLKTIEIAELQKTLKELRVKLSKLSFELEANTLKNYSEIGKTRKEIARVLTEINSRNQ